LCLQNLRSTGLPYLVTMNPPKEPKHIVDKWQASHLIPSLATATAAKQLEGIQGKQGIWFLWSLPRYLSNVPHRWCSFLIWKSWSHVHNWWNICKPFHTNLRKIGTLQLQWSWINVNFFAQRWSYLAQNALYFGVSWGFVYFVARLMCWINQWNLQNLWMFVVAACTSSGHGFHEDNIKVQCVVCKSTLFQQYCWNFLDWKRLQPN
jgi:hypothetical protein